MRIGLFVNVSNQFSALCVKRKGYRVDYDYYLTFAKQYGTLLTATAYGIQSGEEARSFIYILKKLGYSTRFVNAYPDSQPNRNVEITLDVLRMKDRLDLVILGSNDQELIPLIQYLQDIGIRVVVASVNLLHQEALENIELLEREGFLMAIADMREKK